MGIYAAKFRKDNFQALPKDCHPSKADWITEHAVVTKLAIVEVERLWKRFQQLGCNENGVVTDGLFQQNESPVVQDIFAKNILTVLRSDDGSIKFLAFLNCMQWAENAPLDHKISAVFHLLNNGQPITRNIIFRILARVYKSDTKEEHERLTDILMEQLQGSTSGAVTEEQFVKRVKVLPPETIAEVFSFLIVPQEINEEARRAFTSQSKAAGHQANRRSAIPEDPEESFKEALQEASDHECYEPGDQDLASPESPQHPEPEQDYGRQVPSDDILEKIADKVQYKDWHMLANKLNFTAEDIQRFQTNNQSDESSQVFSMLKGWKQREGTEAHAEILEKNLQECNMNDAAMLLYP